MQIVESVSRMLELSRDWPPKAKVGFVPTMGYLHAGHLSLVQQANLHCDITVVSIYVNPAQFGPKEDLANYPRDIDRDLQLLGNSQVDYVFFPATKEIYPEDYRTWVEVDGLSGVLCGGSRPGHFKGVATIVLKLVNIVKPHLMFMGEKDFQQVVVLQTMLRDLNVSTQIVPCPIVREKDGLAMSSRNVYLNPQEREQALCLSEAIQIIKSLYKKGITNSDELIRRGSEIIERKDGRLDYLKLVDSNSLEDMTVADSHTRIILAVFIGRTRLIDNQAMV